MNSTKIILIGCGAVAEVLYAPAIRELLARGEIHDVLVIDQSKTRLEQVRRILPNVSGHSSLLEVQQELNGSLAIVALPNDLHAPVTIQALQHGAHVLCEKPMARTTEECDRMLDAAAAMDRILAVGHFRRFFPITRLIGEWVRDERLGRLNSFRILEGEIYSWPIASTAFSSRASAGGGVLIDTGVHTIDLLLWWLGAVADMEYHDDAAGGVEANCVMRIMMQNGAAGYVQLSRDWPLANQYLFQFEKGWLLYTCDIVNSFEWGWLGDDLAQRVEIANGVRTGFDGLPKFERVEFDTHAMF